MEDGEVTLCPCGAEPHVFPAHLQAEREALRVRAVEMGLRSPEKPLSSLCGECILERLCVALLNDDDVLGEDEEPSGFDWDGWIDGIQDRMGKDERRMW